MPDLKNQVCNSVSGGSSNYKGIKHKEDIQEFLDILTSQKMIYIQASPHIADNAICTGYIKDCAEIIQNYVENHQETEYYKIIASSDYFDCY